MKFLFNLLFVSFLIFHHVSFAVADEECSAEPISNLLDCYRVPDLYQVTLFELGYCNDLNPSSAISETSLPDISSRCQTTYNNPTGYSIAVENNVATPISGGTSTRPPNNTYYYGYLKVDAKIVLRSTHTFATIKRGTKNQVDGYTCWTSGDVSGTTSNCGTAENADPKNVSIEIPSLGCATSPLGANFYCRYENDAEGLDDTYAWLVDADGNLSTSTNYSSSPGDVKYIIGVAKYNTPIVVNDNTQGGEALIRVSRGLKIYFFSDGGGDRVNFGLQEFKTLTTTY